MGKYNVSVKDWFADAVEEAAGVTEKAVNNGLSTEKAVSAMKYYVEEILPEAIEIKSVKD